MSRYIDADALIAEMHNVILEDGEDRRIFYEVIERQPTVDAVDVKHGEWIEQDDGNSIYHKCSVCGKNQYNVLLEMMQGDYHYCPNCGAKMDGKEQNDEE